VYDICNRESFDSIADQI
jgi:GTPase SAR1 family protein